MLKGDWCIEMKMPNVMTMTDKVVQPFSFFFATLLKVVGTTRSGMWRTQYL